MPLYPAPLSGGTYTGALDVNVLGNNASLPLGYTDAADYGLDLIGSSSGGPGNSGNGDTDSTSRINAYVYQQCQGTAAGQAGQYGEFARAFMMRAYSHPVMAWYGPVGGFTGGTPNGTTWTPKAWIGAQYTDVDGVTLLKHLALEVPTSAGAMIGRFVIPFGDTAGTTDVGLDTTNIHTNAANFVVGAASGRLGIAGVPGNQRTLEFNSDTAPSFAAAKTRWKWMANATTETGTNAGSDMELQNYSDSGAAIGTVLFAKRSSSNIVIGQNSELATPGRLQIVWGGGSHGINVQPTATPGTNASYATILTVAGDRAMDCRVAADTTGRHVVFADGKHEWGPGNAGRDVNLYRSAAGVLTTDQALKVGGNVGFYGTTPAAKPTITGAKGSNAALGSLLTALAGLGLLTDSTTA